METEAQTTPTPPSGGSRLAADDIVGTSIAVLVAVTGVMFLLVGAFDFLRGQRINARILRHPKISPPGAPGSRRQSASAIGRS